MGSRRWDPAMAMATVQEFGEFGGINPSICDSSTFTFLEANEMEQTFMGRMPGCYLYSRHYNPTVAYLGRMLCAMEDTEDCQPMASGMAAITTTLMQLCDPRDEIVSSRTIYGGTHALLENIFPRKMGVKVCFVDPTDTSAFNAATNERTRAYFIESVSNPLLEVADLPALSKLARSQGIKVVVDNTFAPMVITPAHHGADVVIHSLTKFTNGASDCVGGAVLGSHDFVSSLRDLHTGPAMLFGPTLDGLRAAGIAKNLRTLHVRMMQHSRNARYLADRFRESGIPVIYPGLPDHPQHRLMRRLYNGKRYGFGGMLAADLGSKTMADKLLKALQMRQVGYLAVSLGFYRTLFSSPSASTSSEVPREEQERMGLKPGLARFSVGLDADIEDTWARFKDAAREVGFLLRKS